MARAKNPTKRRTAAVSAAKTGKAAGKATTKRLKEVEVLSEAVETLIRHRKEDDHFRVKWSGLPTSANSWEHVSRLPTDLVEAWNSRQKAAAAKKKAAAKVKKQKAKAKTAQDAEAAAERRREWVASTSACEECDGTGKKEMAFENGGGFDYDCRDCHGNGRY